MDATTTAQEEEPEVYDSFGFCEICGWDGPVDADGVCEDCGEQHGPDDLYDDDDDY